VPWAVETAKIRMSGCLLLDLIFVLGCQFILAVRDGEEWCFVKDKSASRNIASRAESLAFEIDSNETVG